jgi:hypothetical protein
MARPGAISRRYQLGRLNLVTAEKVLQGIAEVKVGKTFCLSPPLDIQEGTSSVRGAGAEADGAERAAEHELPVAVR